MTDLATLRPQVVARMQFIETVLAHYGSINRAVVMDYFGLSSPQVSIDFGLYQELAPDNMLYDLGQKRYERSPTFKRVWE